MEKFIKDFQIQRVYKKGEILYYENTPSLGLYCINKGTVKIYSSMDKGREVILRLAREGEIFGYGHLLGEKVHKDSARALEDTQCYFIDAYVLKDLLTRDPELSTRLLKMVGKELFETQNRCVELIKKNVRERLASYFHYMSQHHGEVINGKTKIKIQLSREEIASMIGTASETAIRFISEFKEMGLIQEEDRFFHIVNPEALVNIGRH
jgi:CRP-like cAMP-binding protein